MNTLAEAELDLLEFFKALSDPTRLQIAGALARRPVETRHGTSLLAAELGLKPAVVARHLRYLEHFQLARAKNGRWVLALDTIHALAARTSPARREPELDDDLEAFDRKVLTAFLDPDGRLRELPASDKKLLAILRHVVKVFEPGQSYPETAVNALLQRFSDDTASLRRYLVDFNLMSRAGGIYRKS